MEHDDDAVTINFDSAFLSESQRQDLEKKFGIRLQLETRSQALSKVLGRAGDAAEYDRTSPGYDRNFDRTGPEDEGAPAFINPVDLEHKVRVAAERILNDRAKKSG